MITLELANSLCKRVSRRSSAAEGLNQNWNTKLSTPHSALLGARFLYFSVAPNPLFHSVFLFAVLGGTSFYCMTIAGKRITTRIVRNGGCLNFCSMPSVERRGAEDAEVRRAYLFCSGNLLTTREMPSRHTST